MTPQEIQIAVAEEMGWIKFWQPDSSNDEGVGHWEWHLGKKNIRQLPPYTTSIDAIREACLERFKGLNRWDFERQLLKRADAITTGDRTIWQLTALDWCEAFISTVEQLKKT